MNAKLKYSLLIVALVVVVAASVGITYGVMAARTIAVESNINVGYQSDQVAAKLSATYQVKGSETATDFVTEDGSKVIEFTGGEKTADASTASLKSFEGPAANDTKLDAEHDTITFVFTIENKTEGTITAVLTMPTTANNVIVTKSATNTATGSNVENSTINIATDTTATFTVTVAIDKPARNASFSGNFSWRLTRAAA